MIDLFIIWVDGYTYYVCTCVCTIARRPEVIAQTPGGALSQGASRQLLADRRKRREQRRQHRHRSHPPIFVRTEYRGVLSSARK